MTSELSKYLSNSWVYFQTAKMKLDKNKKKIDFKAKTLLHNVIFYQILLLFKFSKISYVLL